MNNAPRARKIAEQALASPNPGPAHVKTDLHMKLSVYDMCLRMFGEHVNMSSLSEREWISLFRRHGATEDEAIQLYENVAAWSVTDEV